MKYTVFFRWTHVLEVGHIVVFYRDNLLQNENSVIIYFIYPDAALNLNDSRSPVKQKTFWKKNLLSLVTFSCNIIC